MIYLANCQVSARLRRSYSKMVDCEMMAKSLSLINKLPDFMESVRRGKASNIKKAVESEVVS